MSIILTCETCDNSFDPIGGFIHACQFCGGWTCKGCGNGDGEDFSCNLCLEAICVKCGGEGGQVLAGDEAIWRCGDCGYIDMEK